MLTKGYAFKETCGREGGPLCRHSHALVCDMFAKKPRSRRRKIISDSLTAEYKVFSMNSNPAASFFNIFLPYKHIQPCGGGRRSGFNGIL